MATKDPPKWVFVECFHLYYILLLPYTGLGLFRAVKSPIEACALGGGGVCSLKTANIKTETYSNLSVLYTLLPAS